MEVLHSGQGELFQKPDPDAHRAYLRDHRARSVVSKLMTEQEAVSKFVSDGDYICYDCNYFMRGPASLVREIIRQRKKKLGIGARFTYMEVILLAGAGCLDRVDVGYMGVGRILTKMIEDGVRVTEWSNSALTMRQLAGSMGIPFIPIRFLGGTDAYKNSGAMTVKDPFTGKETVLAPALNPDVSLIHAHQCDIYGNARIFGTSVSPVETAAAGKKVIVSTEEIIETEYIRRDPGLTTIPYYLVDAVVHAPYGGLPGEVAGMYASDTEGVIEALQAGIEPTGEALKKYLEKHVYGVANHQEYLQKVIGLPKLLQLKDKARITEGYHA